MADSELGHYVYAVGGATSLAGVAELSGIDDAPVSCTVADELCALTSAVSVPAFRAAQQASELSETGWLAGAVRAHERVVVHAAERGAVLPMRFGTVYSRHADVEAMLHRHQASLRSELHRLGSGTEWCLTVRSGDTAEQSSRELSEDEQRAASAIADQPASGTAWLLSRQAALRARESHDDRLAEHAERLRAALAEHARDIVQSRPAGGAGNAVRLWLLVDDVSRLHAAVDELRTRPAGDVVLELTGPWPAYHFVRTDALHGDVDTGADANRASGDLSTNGDPAGARR